MVLLVVLAIVVVLAVLCPPRAFSQVSPSDDRSAIETDLGQDLQIVLQQARDVQSDLSRGVFPPNALAALVASFDRIRAEDLLIAAHQQSVETRLKEQGASATVIGRHEDMTSSYRLEMDQLHREMDDIAIAGQRGDRAGLEGSLDALIRHLETQVMPPERISLGVGLPYRTLKLDLPHAAPQLGPVIVPAYADRSLPQPQASDLGESPDAPLTPEILAQARTLHQNPIEIFEFVQNQIDMEFYHGAMKGAVETLRQKSGNDIDQASLLMALFRASGIPARYVRGVIALSGPQALAWTAMSSTRRAAEVLTKAGIPFEPVQQGGTIGAFRIEHTWVEAYVPYGNYRGAPLDASGKAWIPLDPSIKSYQYDAGTDLPSAMNFTADLLVPEYLSAPQALSPVDFYRKKITDYLTRYRADLTYEQVVGKQTIQVSSMGLLPSTLPYATVSVNFEGNALADALRHTVRFVAEGEGGASFDVTLPTSDLLGRRLTVSYVPATVEDHVAVDAFVSLDNTPAYLVKLRPVVKVGGVIRGAGERPVQMGALHGFTIELQTPRGTMSIPNQLVAGGYYAIGLGGQKVSYAVPEVPALEDTEPSSADLLYVQAADYLDALNQAEHTIADMLRVVVVRPMLSEVMVGNVYNRTILFGQPQAIDWRGVFVDADLRISEPVPVGAEDGAARHFMRLSALAGSMFESGILERNLEADAVSAAKLIQLAHDAGIPVDEIDSSNVGAALPRLQTADSIKADIADAVNQGWRVTIPRTDLTRHSWTGTGYIVEDPDTGSSGYFISGFLAGGMTTPSPEDWVKQELKDRFKFANTPPPNTDPTAAVSIEQIPVSNHQDGTVGKQLAKPIAVWVRDKANRPVKGVEVTFISLAGGSAFVSLTSGISSFTTVKTDALGIARANPYLGEKTSAYPFYVKAKPTDTHITQVGQNIVTAKFSVGGGDVFMDIPFQLFGYPDQPHHIRKVLGEGAAQYSGTWAGTLRARVEDRYDNPVSNADVNFFVRPPALYSGFVAPDDPMSVPYAGPLPANFINVKIYPSGSCANPIPILGQCSGVETVTLKSSIFGASVETILGNTFNTKFNVEVAALGTCSAVCVDTFHLYSLGTRDYGTGAYDPPTVQMTGLQFVNDRGEVLNGTKVGTKFKYPLEIALFVRQDEYTIVPNPSRGPTCATPDPPCWIMQSLETRQVRPVDFHLPGTISFPTLSGVASRNKSDETADVTFAITQGGGSVAPIPPLGPGGGRHGTYLTVGPNPALNKVEVTAIADVWVPYLDGYTGDLMTVMARLEPGQSVGGFDLSQIDSLGNSPKPLATDFPVTLTHEVFGVRATVDPVKKFPLGEEFTTADFDITYKIEPPEYHAQIADIDIFEVDPAAPLDAENCTCKWLGLWVGDNTSGAGKARVFQGTGIDYKKSYRLQSVLNRGGNVEVKSVKQNLNFLAGKITYTYYKADPVIGLDYAHPDKNRRAKGVVVKLLDSGGAVVQTLNATERGFYSFDAPAAAGNYQVVVNAELGDPATPHVKVVNNTSAGALYSFPFTVPWTGTASLAKDIHFDSGWTAGPTYSAPRDAAPFAILDTIYQGEKLIKVADSSSVFPLLVVNWSKENKPSSVLAPCPGDPTKQCQSYSTGDIETSHHRLDVAGISNLYILGSDGFDTDEYDSHVIAHEWGHYIEEHFSRSDSIGGDHSNLDILDPRVAFGEGWGNALSGMILNDPLYVDTSGPSQGCDGTGCLNRNVDTDMVPDADTHPSGIRYDGYYAQTSVQEVLWDLFDSGAGKVGLGFTPIYQVMVGGQKTTPAFTSIFSVLHYLKSANPAVSANITALALAENIVAGDEYEGATQKIYTPIPVDGTDVTTDVSGRLLQTWSTYNETDLSDWFNRLDNRMFFKFSIPSAATYTITLTAIRGNNLFFSLNERGTMTSGVTSGSTEKLNKDLTPGPYTLDVFSTGGPGWFKIKIEECTIIGPIPCL